MARVSRPVRILAVLALLGASCVPGGRADERLGVAVPIEASMPELRGETLVGDAFDPASLEGRVALVNFWATWCGPCRREQPELQETWERFGDRGLAVVGVNERDDPAAARAWVEEFGVTYPSIVDQPGAYAARFGFIGLPATYLVDREGTMRYRIFGTFDPGELDRLIRELLVEDGG